MGHHLTNILIIFSHLFVFRAPTQIGIDTDAYIDTKTDTCYDQAASVSENLLAEGCDGALDGDDTAIQDMAQALALAQQEAQQLRAHCQDHAQLKLENARLEQVLARPSDIRRAGISSRL